MGKNTEIEVGIVGGGKMGLHHIRAIQARHAGRIVGIADPAVVPATLQPLLPPGARIFASAEEMLDTTHPTVVHIVTPPATHVELASLCLSRGAHVYVEKPFTLSAADAEAVLAMARRHGLSVCAGHQLLFEKPGRALIAALPMIGRVIHVESYFSFRTVRRSRDGRTPLSPIEQLLDILPHPVYLLLDALQAADPSTASELASLEVRPEGDVHAILHAGQATGVLVVTLRGRPIESYLRIVGTNGCLRADFVRGSLTALPGPGASAIALVQNAYKEGWQTLSGSTKGFGSRIFGSHKSYPGLGELIEAFYTSIRGGTPPPFGEVALLDTVRTCERVGAALRAAEVESEKRAEAGLVEASRALRPPDDARGVVLVTGGAGLLGAAVVTELRGNGWAVRSVGRRIPPPSARVAGVEYAAVDLGAEIDPALLQRVSAIVHCAAETGGGKEAHERNTIGATRNLLRSAAAAGVSRFVHISSIAVLKPGQGGGAGLSEHSPVDTGNLARGPYVWGKAEAERVVLEEGKVLGLAVRVVRPGPLVDFDAFEPPGRLGKDVGMRFVAIGPRSSRISLCDVRTAARVLRTILEDFEHAPPVLHLIDPSALTRKDLVEILRKSRPDLKVMWIPRVLLAVASPGLKLLQRVVFRGKTPIDIAAAFSSERYDTALISPLIQRSTPQAEQGKG